jgi:hypothetical protein
VTQSSFAPPRLKPGSFVDALRGAEAPLFHGAAGVGGSGRIRIKVKSKDNIKVKGKSKI